ncbi:hypothetical protein ACOME3_010748 [Neoechinorhynchus agilis]
MTGLLFSCFETFLQTIVTHNALDLYCPVQWEFGRLNLYYAVVSKRKLLALIESGIVKDWDDPRLFTLTALRRRGVPPEAINLFCSRIGITVAQTTLHPSLLDACTREVLNLTAPRAMVVKEPLPVEISNLKSMEELVVPDFPNIKEHTKNKTHRITFKPDCIFIEKSDFREVGIVNDGYKRLTLSQPVGLRYSGYVIFVTDVNKNDSNEIVSLKVRAEKAEKCECKPQAFIHWVSDAINVELRIFDQLFIHPNPEDTNTVPGGYLSDVNPNSLTVIKDAKADRFMKDVKAYQSFQFERLGYFNVDPESIPESKLIFNLTVSLREDPTKKSEEN